MSDAHGGGGNGFGIVILIIGGIIAIWALAHGTGTQRNFFGQGNASSTNATSSFFTFTPLYTPGTSTPPARENSRDFSFGSEGNTPAQTPYVPPPPTTYEIETHIANAAQEVDRLKEQVRIAKLWGVISPYRNQVSFSSGNAWSDDPKTEYLSLSVHGRDAVDVSGWHIESTVTGNGAQIGFGTHLPKNGHVNSGDNIVIDPGETAYLLTGESPIGTSFHENKCTGYFEQYQHFSPSLSQQCPYPLDEMKKFSRVDVDNDACYFAVQGLSSCKVVDEERLSTTTSSACRSFISNDLTYAGCVKNHSTDPFFYNGSWYIYLSRDTELWRSQREIIRLLDAQNRTVAVLEY